MFIEFRRRPYDVPSRHWTVSSGCQAALWTAAGGGAIGSVRSHTNQWERYMKSCQKQVLPPPDAVLNAASYSMYVWLYRGFMLRVAVRLPRRVARPHAATVLGTLQPAPHHHLLVPSSWTSPLASAPPSCRQAPRLATLPPPHLYVHTHTHSQDHPSQDRYHTNTHAQKDQTLTRSLNYTLTRLRLQRHTYTHTPPHTYMITHSQDYTHKIRLSQNHKHKIVITQILRSHSHKITQTHNHNIDCF